MKQTTKNNKTPNKKAKKNAQKPFTSYIDSIRKNVIGPSGDKVLSKKELGDMLGIGYEQYRKILNLNKITDKRDCIIATCAMLKMDRRETDKALILYQNMSPLSARNPRDKLLIQILDEQYRTPLSVEEINERLIRNNFKELDIIDHKMPVKKAPSKRPPFILLDKNVTPSMDAFVFGDPYDSLDTKFGIYKYECRADMWLGNTVGKKIHHLCVNAFWTAYPRPQKVYRYSLLKPNIIESIDYNSPEEAGLFKDYFLELESMADYELNCSCNTLNDTKNYQSRVSAGIYNDALHVYAETFNYSIPELHEYYLFEYINRTMRLSVYENSEFMRCYLLPDEYTSAYGENPNMLVAQYNSIDELETAPDDEGIRDRIIRRARLRSFKNLKDKSDALISDLRNHKQYIRHLEYYCDDPDRVCVFFNVEQEFDCKADDDNADFMIAGINSYAFTFDDCGTVVISLDDLYHAFELGFNTIHEICRVKANLGSISKILE